MHPTHFFISPAPGLQIADPVTGEYLPENGATMPRSGFWLRRLADGDVLETKPEMEKATGSRLPRSASEAKTALFANESECLTGREAERHTKE